MQSRAAITLLFLTLVAAQKPLSREVPLFPRYSALEWEKIYSSQALPEPDDFSKVTPGTEFQPENSGKAIIAPPEGKIVNGNVAYRGQFPWQAGILIDGSYFCGGSLISRTVVLTAGHCVYKKTQWAVSMGAHFIRKDEKSKVTKASATGVLHENYDNDNISNDIAVIILNEEFPLNNAINAIRLPGRSMQSETFEKEILTVSGWGRRDSGNNISPVLNYVNLEVIANTDCANYFGNYIQSSNICGSGEKGRSACNGDSGGPFAVTRNETSVVVGIVSFGTPLGCSVGYPSAFTRVTAYLPWIQGKTGIIIPP